MGWSYGQIRRLKTGKESRNWREKEDRKTEIAMGDCMKKT